MISLGKLFWYQPLRAKRSPGCGPPREMSEMSKIVLEAGRVATEKMLDYYKRMGIRVTPQMTLAPERKKRPRKPKASAE